jgi:hypothetical protein
MREGAALSLALVCCFRACHGDGTLDVEQTSLSELLYLSVIVTSAIPIRASELHSRTGQISGWEEALSDRLS